MSAGLVDDDNLYVWEASIFGPEESPWEGGVFSLSMVFPETYPMKPPLVRFTTEVFHPNVYADGTLCLDILQDAWSPVQSVASVLKSIQSLLTDPNVDSPANTEAAGNCIKRIVRSIVVVYVDVRTDLSSDWIVVKNLYL